MWPMLVSAIEDLKPGAEVLEAGTGQGGMFAYLVELLGRRPHRWRLTTVDPDPAACESARGRLQRLPDRLSRRVQVLQRDIIDVAKERPRSCHLVVASALLSAVPLRRQLAQERVLAALAHLVAPGGRLMIEDYLPLAQPGPTAGDPAEVARALWRVDKALAELAGRPHYDEVTPSALREILSELGFDVAVSLDERQLPRGEKVELGVVGGMPDRPQYLDPALWAALDRYRRGLLSEIAAAGLVQWSGWYRLSASKL